MFRDREIQFYELSSFEPYCQISGLESVPLKMDYWYLFTSNFFGLVQFIVIKDTIYHTYWALAFVCFIFIL